MNQSKFLDSGATSKPASPAKSQKARSPAQIAASRANGAKSSGPTSAEGKRRSSLNAILHGLTCTEHTLLVTEDPVQYKEVCDAFVDDLRPATKAELRLVEKIANLDWRLERMVMMETCVLNMEVGCNAEKIAEKFLNIDGIGFIVEAWKESLSATHCLDLLRRYMGTMQHQFNTTLSNFYKLEKHRLARRHDPDSLEPYQRPSLTSLDPIKEEAEPPQNEEPSLSAEPQAGMRNEPKPDSKSVTPIDIRNTIAQFHPTTRR